jgi:hypothetical protein
MSDLKVRPPEEKSRSLPTRSESVIASLGMTNFLVRRVNSRAPADRTPRPLHGLDSRARLGRKAVSLTRSQRARAVRDDNCLRLAFVPCRAVACLVVLMEEVLAKVSCEVPPDGVDVVGVVLRVV